MLDVHAPEHIHGVRDFFIHILTITVGLFIALSLEAGVEAAHHRHQRKEAEANIRAEIADNRAKIQGGGSFVIAERDNIAKILRICELRSHGQPGTLHGLAINFSEAPLRDAAWRTANSAGVLAYMEFGEAERFSDAYKEQELLQNTEEKTLEDYLQLDPVISHPGEDLTPDIAKEALPYLRRTLAHLNGMLAVGRGTLEAYDEALK